MNKIMLSVGTSGIYAVKKSKQPVLGPFLFWQFGISQPFSRAGVQR